MQTALHSTFHAPLDLIGVMFRPQVGVKHKERITQLRRTKSDESDKLSADEIAVIADFLAEKEDRLRGLLGGHPENSKAAEDLRLKLIDIEAARKDLGLK